MYTGAASAPNDLRGVQETDASGQATFVSIFPACHAGRWPHGHAHGGRHGLNHRRPSGLAPSGAACIHRRIPRAA
jgi:protocatechuate 3,4-dioxygenase beta subunit